MAIDENYVRSLTHVCQKCKRRFALDKVVEHFEKTGHMRFSRMENYVCVETVEVHEGMVYPPVKDTAPDSRRRVQRRS